MDRKTVQFECKCGRLLDWMVDPYRLVYPDCPECGKMMYYVRSKRGRPPTHNFDTPIEMYSCGLIEGELAAFKIANDRIDLTDQGVPIAKNRQEKLQVLKYFGMKENN